jgi:hypothetical protein
VIEGNGLCVAPGNFLPVIFPSVGVHGIRVAEVTGDSAFEDEVNVAWAADIVYARSLGTLAIYICYIYYGYMRYTYTFVLYLVHHTYVCHYHVNGN